MTEGAARSDETIAARVRAEVDRAIQRRIKGLDFLTSPGPAMGTTPKDVIYERRTLKLYHYRPLADEVYRVPLVLVMSLVSRPYILDLTQGQSLVEFLLTRGFDVYMIDWGAPRPEDHGLRIDDYVLDFIPDCVERVLADSGEPDVSIVAYCMGGTLAVMYAALHTDGPLKNLACFATPVNYEGMGLFRKWSDRRYFDVDRLVDTLGNVPPELIYASFDMLRPATRWASSFRLWDQMWNDEFVKSYRVFDRWAVDQIPFAGEAFRQMTKELMWENRLYRNELRLGGRRVDLGRITVPLLHVMAEHDHIAPYEAVRDLVKLVGSTDKRDVVLKGGHVSLVAGPSAVGRMWPLLDAWLAERSV
jgi:poly[(R)-3-hydroxyalkanoate] polymerase subunit PhaC